MFKTRVSLWWILALVGFMGGFAMASRNSGGSYSLPAGNPVVTGTTITSTWANTTLSDIKTEITNSLDRQGRGGMLAPLQCVSGTVAAPGISFSTEPSSGLYRAGAGDNRYSLLGSDLLKLTSSLITSYQPLTVTGRTTTTDLTVSGTSDSLAVTASVAGFYGVAATGNTSGIGVVGIGGNSSVTGGVQGSGGAAGAFGVKGVGANAGGIGVVALGGTTSGDAITATAIGGNGRGVLAVGQGSGAGVSSSGGATSGTGIFGTGGAPNGIGIQGTGTGSGAGISATGGTSAAAGLIVAHGTAATAAVRQDAIQSTNGDINLNGVAAPNSDVAFTNRITPKNLIKAFANITLTGAATMTLNDGFNVASISYDNLSGGGHGNDAIVVTFAAPMSSSSFASIVTGTDNSGAGNHLDCEPFIAKQTSAAVWIQLQRSLTVACSESASGGTYVVWGPTEGFSLVVIGAQ